MPISCSGPRTYAGDLFIPGAIQAAIVRTRAERRPILIRRTMTWYDILIQSEDEIDPLEDARLQPVTYATVVPAHGDYVNVVYMDGRVELA